MAPEFDRSKVRVVIPTLNEEAAIAQVVEGFRQQGFTHITVLDGHSGDRTVERARAAGAEVVQQEGTGKGAALAHYIPRVQEEVFLMIDGDGTYLPSDAGRLLHPIESGMADHVIGNRFAGYQGGAFTRLNLLGNKILNKIFGMGYGAWLSDILSGYRAFRTGAARAMALDKSGFEVETEMTVESVKLGHRIAEVPITYLPRTGGARPKLHPLRDGLRIFYTIGTLAKTYNPMFYFGLLGIGSLAAGFLLGLWLLSEFYLRGATHVFFTFFDVLILIVGFQVLLFGLMANLQVMLHKEMLRELRKR
ncbi:MAG: S-layer glycoprotein N-glycosyltransferase AglJ [Euryarchaeota archaeon]|nr:S-layer glycoprotein N-glycosyltransferase AglJ [Euryarchaeota archaeon]